MLSDKQIAREIVKSWKKEDFISALNPRIGRLERRIAAALAAARQPEQGAQTTPPEGELISREAAIERAAVSIAEYVQAPASFIGTIEQIIRRELTALPAAPAECLMADCVEPQAHFCVTHVLEVHAAPTDEQLRKDIDAVSLNESRLKYNNDQLRRERDELREALRECVDEIDSILITN